MKITEVQAAPITIPYLTAPISTAALKEPLQAMLGVVVRAAADGGETGFAEVAVVPSAWGETQQTVVAIVEEHLSQRLVGCDPRDTERISWALDPPQGIAGNVIAKAGVDIAIHDLLARSLDLPLYKHLGGWSDPPVVTLSWMFGIAPPEEIAAEARQRVAAGFGAFKVKVGIDPERDLATVKALRAEVGPNALIYVDANHGYEASVAVRTIARMEEHGIAWVEDPFPKGLPLHLRQRAAASLNVPILADSTCETPADTLRELDAGLAQIVGIKLQRSGFTNARKIATLAEAFGSRCILSIMSETYLGTLAAAHLAAGLRNVVQPAEITGALRLSSYLRPGAPTIEDGAITLSPLAPGNGAELDEQLLARYATGPIPWANAVA